MCEITVHLLVIVQNNNWRTVQVKNINILLLLLLLRIGLEQVHTKKKSNTGLNTAKYLRNDADFWCSPNMEASLYDFLEWKRKQRH